MASSPAPTPPAGDALLDAGESMKCLAEVKDALDIEVKQNFIDPLQNLCDKDLKEIQVRPDGLPRTPTSQHSPPGSLPGPSLDSEPLPILGSSVAHLCTYLQQEGPQGVG